jgi:tetratricopeptide (TPR) repeat protein
MLEYEDSGGKAIQSHIYFSFILNAALCLLELKRYEEVLQVLSKTRSIEDYLVPINRGTRVDYLTATAHVYLGNTQAAREILDALLDYDELDFEDEDIGGALILRSVILSQSDKMRARQDLERGTEILKSLGLNQHVANFIEDFPQLRQNQTTV